MRHAIFCVLFFASLTRADNLIPSGDHLGVCQIVASGAAKLGPVGDSHRDAITNGYALDSSKPSGEITAAVDHLDAGQGR